MRTYTLGYRLKTERVITKNDIISMCNLLNARDEYLDLCEFKPEAISEGGIVFKFKDGCDANWYKSVRLCVSHGGSKGKWYFIKDNVMNEWSGNNDIIFSNGNKFDIFLKSFHGAPLFTLAELKIWEECFNQIGIVKVGKYPSKNSLSTSDDLIC